MQGEAAGQLPDALYGVELRTIRRQEVELEAFGFGALLSPWLVENRVMISDVVDNERDAPTTLGCDGPPLFQEGMEGHGIEAVGFPSENEFAVSQANGPEVSHTPTTGVMQQNGLTILRRDPHAAPRSVLLEMDFIGCPEIDVLVGGQLAEFFYMPAGVPGPRGRSSAVACVVGSLTCEKSSGTAAPQDRYGTGRE